MIPNTKQSTNFFYIVNIEIETCSYAVRIFDVSYKHQKAVLVKFGISTFNYILSLTPDNYILYTYIILGK